MTQHDSRLLCFAISSPVRPPSPPPRRSSSRFISSESFAIKLERAQPAARYRRHTRRQSQSIAARRTARDREASQSKEHVPQRAQEEKNDHNHIRTNIKSNADARHEINKHQTRLSPPSQQPDRPEPINRRRTYFLSAERHTRPSSWSKSPDGPYVIGVSTHDRSLLWRRSPIALIHDDLGVLFLSPITARQ